MAEAPGRTLLLLRGPKAELFDGAGQVRAAALPPGLLEVAIRTDIFRSLAAAPLPDAR